MTDLAADRAIKQGAEKLVADVSRRWPAEAMKSVHDDMEYGQYAEAVLNLIAIHQKQNLRLSMAEAQEIVELVGRMSIEQDVGNLMRFLRASPAEATVDRDEDVLAFLLQAFAGADAGATGDAA